MMKWGLGAIGLAVALIVGATALGLGGASAQTPTPQNTTEDQHFLQVFADKLGVSVDQVKAAAQATRDQIIDEKVAAGDITADQAAKLKAMPLGASIRLGAGRHGPGQKLVHGVVDIFQKAVDIIGLPADQVRSRLRGGESLNDIAVSQGVNNLHDQLVARLTQDINTAVANGKLDQGRADKLTQNLDKIVDKTINHKGGAGKGLRNFGAQPTPTP